jgi:hypothetical protein
MNRGKKAGYYWLEEITPTQEWLSLENLLEVCPEFVLGKYLVITAWDSGPLKLRDEDYQKGWLKHDRLAINSAVQSVNDIPYMGYDEWYIFSETPLWEPFKVFVNDWYFSLREPEGFASDGDSSEAIIGRRDEVERMRELQELFWLQLELKRAETYISAGHRFILATREKKLYERMIEPRSNVNSRTS